MRTFTALLLFIVLQGCNLCGRDIGFEFTPSWNGTTVQGRIVFTIPAADMKKEFVCNRVARILTIDEKLDYYLENYSSDKETIIAEYKKERDKIVEDLYKFLKAGTSPQGDILGKIDSACTSLEEKLGKFGK